MNDQCKTCFFLQYRIMARPNSMPPRWAKCATLSLGLFDIPEKTSNGSIQNDDPFCFDREEEVNINQHIREHHPESKQDPEYGSRCPDGRNIHTEFN